jgi:ABC-type proline/glycine betaine transport system permease subunit
MEKLFHSQQFRLFHTIVIFTILFLVAFWSEIEQTLIIFSCVGLIGILTFLFWGRWFDVLLLSTVVVLAGIGIVLALHFAFDSPFKWDERTAVANLNLAYTLISFLFAFYVSLRLITRFVLPVQTRAERKDVFGRLWLYMRGKRACAICA